MKNILFILLIFNVVRVSAQDRPNILWLVTEDMSPYLRCYGNTLVNTPNLDKLASQGIRFTQARSNGTQCSPSRSTLISGVYAISFGTEIHREGRPVPRDLYFPRFMRQAGYYTSNNSKKDYNDKGTPDEVWNESNGKASYLNRPNKSDPFFSVFNCGITHMTRVVIPLEERTGVRKVAMKDVQIPGYIPDLPEVRNDIAWNMDAVMLMDEWVGEKLAELKKSGEADNTIIFFYSDHGGTVPRGKAYVYESGTRVPFIAYFPKKWEHLAGNALPAVSNRLVSFIDFPPTVLNLAGARIPEYMKGKPFFGAGANQPENINQYTITFRANQGDSFSPSRGITNGAYKLIWNYQGAYPNGTRQDYQWQMPAQQAWDIANRENRLSLQEKKFWLPVEPFEFYHLEKDSLELNNLASNGAYLKVFEELKARLQAELRKQQDLGFMPRMYRQELQAGSTLFDVVRKNKINVINQITAAETASLKKMSNLKILTAYLSDKDPVIQYWGASGICGLARAGSLKSLSGEVNLTIARTDVIPEVKSMLAEAMVYAGRQKEGLNYLLNDLKAGFGPAAAALQNIGELAKPIAAEVQVLLNAQKGNKNKFYMRSVLINCGVLPYSALYPAGEKVGD